MLRLSWSRNSRACATLPFLRAAQGDCLQGLQHDDQLPCRRADRHCCRQLRQRPVAVGGGRVQHRGRHRVVLIESDDGLTTFEKVQRECNGFRTCLLTASDELRGAECAESYLDVDFACRTWSSCSFAGSCLSLVARCSMNSVHIAHPWLTL